MTKSKKLAKKAAAKRSAKPTKTEPGYMYIGHLPHGFYENQIKSYFSQFGRIVKVRLARSKKTGSYKGYGFVQFKDIEVAKIAAQTMNNYLMFNKILKCQIIPKEKLHKFTFRNSHKTFFKALASIRRRKFNRPRSAKDLKALQEKQAKRLSKKQKKLAEMGINLDFSQLSKFETKPDSKAKAAKEQPEEKKTAPKRKAVEEKAPEPLKQEAKKTKTAAAKTPAKQPEKVAVAAAKEVTKPAAKKATTEASKPAAKKSKK